MSPAPVRCLQRASPAARKPRGENCRLFDCRFHRAPAHRSARRRRQNSRPSHARVSEKSQGARSPKSPSASIFFSTSDSAISRSTVQPPRYPAAKPSAFASPRRSARACAASSTFSTSLRSVFTRATTAACSTRSKPCAILGNTVLVVEHDEETIRRADHVVDLGPGAGSAGGYLVASGTARRNRRESRIAHRAISFRPRANSDSG